MLFFLHTAFCSRAIEEIFRGSILHKTEKIYEIEESGDKMSRINSLSFFFFEVCLLAADIEGILPLLGKAKRRTITDQWKKSNSK